MRTTLAIADDVLIAAKAIARDQGKSVGAVITELARRSLHEPDKQEDDDGIPRLPISRPGAVVTLEIVNALRDEEP